MKYNVEHHTSLALLECGGRKNVITLVVAIVDHTLGSHKNKHKFVQKRCEGENSLETLLLVA